IIPDIVTGTSMGAIVGSIYADTLDIDRTEEIIKGYLNSEEFISKAKNLSLSSDIDKGFLETIYGKAKKGYFFYRFLFRRSVISPELFFLELDQLIPDKKFSELKIPFACMVLDLVSGYPEILHSGPIRPAVRASSAVPGILPPVKIDNRVCVDGGWVERVPISAARALGASFILGVDSSREITPIDYENEIKNSMDVMFRADDIARSLMNTFRTREADFVVYPKVGDADWSDFDHIDTYITAGYTATMESLPALRKALRFRRLSSLLWKRR
ncbi:MAG: patatin-like phospholipase family protein, partial [Desulfomonilia bacterium]